MKLLKKIKEFLFGIEIDFRKERFKYPTVEETFLGARRTLFSMIHFPVNIKYWDRKSDNEVLPFTIMYPLLYDGAFLTMIITPIHNPIPNSKKYASLIVSHRLANKNYLNEEYKREIRFFIALFKKYHIKEEIYIYRKNQKIISEAKTMTKNTPPDIIL